MKNNFFEKNLQELKLKLLSPCSFRWGIPAVLLWSLGIGFWFAALKGVDPVHHALSFYDHLFIRVGLLFLCIAGACLFLLYKYRFKVTPAGMLCAAGAACTAFFPSFTSLALSLCLLSSAVWLCCDQKYPEYTCRKPFYIVPLLLFVYVFGTGLEQQLACYNRLIFLHSDWGIYFSAYRDLAEAPFAGLGRWISSGNHFNPAVNLVMAPLIGLFPRAETLFVINSLLIASVIPLVFQLGRSLRLPLPLCALCSAAAAFNPMLSNQHTTLFYGYHPIIFLLPSFLLFCIAREKNSRWGMILCGLFMCGIKETVFVFGSGAAFLWALKKKWLHAGILLFLCIAAFLTITFVLLPRCDGSSNYFQLFQYRSLGGSTGDLFLSPFLAPEIFWGKLFRTGNLSFLLLLVLPFLPAVWYAPRFLLAALPVTLGVLLKDCYQNLHNVVQWYGIEITVWLMAAMIYGTKACFDKKTLHAGFAAALLTGSLAGYYFVGRTPVGGTYSASAVRQSPDVRIVREAVRKLIPPGASAAVSQKWGAQLADSDKKLIFQLDDPEADYTLLDFTDSSADMKELMRVRDRFWTGSVGHPVRFMNLRGCQIAVFKKGPGPRQLPFILKGAPGKLLPQGIPLDLKTPGLSARAVYLKNQRRLLIFAAAENFGRDVSFQITVRSGNDSRHWSVRWGYGLFPAYMMKKDQSFVIELPLPGIWQMIGALNVTVRTFERK